MVSNIMLTLLFLLGVLAVYYCTKREYRWVILLAANIIFYASGGVAMTAFIGGSILWTYVVGKKIEIVEIDKKKRGWVLAGILPLLGVLFLFKYFNFFSTSMAKALGFFGFEADPLVLKLILPLGISYYTFKIISYLVEIYRGNQKAENHLGYYAVYVSFFPQILSGPIERSAVLLPQIREGATYKKELFLEGIQLIILGLFKKIVIANRLSTYVDTIWGNPEAYPGTAALVAAILYSIQIYCDFSGYSDVAIGMGKLLGYSCNKNFNLPYFSTNIKEFWNRWHISLSSWLKDYIYIPLGGNRTSKLRKNLNILVTFLVSGLWHGDNWTFIFWGGIHGIWSMCSTGKKEIKGVRRVFATLGTFLGVTFAWVFFRANSLSEAIIFLKHMCTDFSLSFVSIQNTVLPFTGDNTCVAHALTVGIFIFLLCIYEWQQCYIEEKKEAEKRNILPLIWSGLFFGILILFGVFGASGFLYAQY